MNRQRRKSVRDDIDASEHSADLKGSKLTNSDTRVGATAVEYI
jgi:hypothetical protein